MLKTLKGKFIVSSLVIILLTVGIPLMFLMMQFKDNFQQRSVVMLDTTLDMLDFGLNNAMMLGFQKNVQQIVNKIAYNENINHIRLFDESGKIKFSSDTTEINKNMFDIAKEHLKGKKSDRRTVKLLKNEGVYSAIHPIENKPECKNCHGDSKNVGYIDVDADLTKAEVKFYTGIYHMLFLAIAILLFLSISMYYLFSNFINKPLQIFVTAIEKIRNGDLNIKVELNKKDEFGFLSRNFNRMVSELKRSREKIEDLHYQDLTRADRLVTLGELAAEMAHEVNNHSAIIMSRADYIQMESESNTNLKEYSKDFEVIGEQVQKIAKITGNILKHSKKLKTDFNEIDLVKIVDESFTLFEHILKKRNIKIIKELNIGEAKINGESSQIEQVLINLIKNSLDAIPNDGTITIGIDKNNNNKFELFVKDTGIGIDEYSINQIFSPFFTTKSADKGTGLGLYIVSNICKNHKAKIICQSKIGEGTKFIITFN